MSWFRGYGPIYLPVRPMGMLITLAFISFSVQIFLHVDSSSHSVSDTLYGIFPFVAPAFLLWQWIAERTSRMVSG